MSQAQSPAKISVPCPSCGRPLRVPESARGRRGRCPGCGGNVDIPLVDTIPLGDVEADSWASSPGFPAVAVSEPDPLPAPSPATPIVQAAVEPRPLLNSVGLVALLLGFLAYVPAALYAMLLLLVGLAKALSGPRSGMGLPGGWEFLLPGWPTDLVGLALAAVSLLIIRLSGQELVRVYVRPALWINVVMSACFGLKVLVVVGIIVRISTVR